MNAPVPPSQFQRRPLSVRMATPRGFCAGVDRAIQIVERAIEKYGAPVYVRHEIVHNRHVVDRLKGCPRSTSRPSAILRLAATSS